MSLCDFWLRRISLDTLTPLALSSAGISQEQNKAVIKHKPNQQTVVSQNIRIEMFWFCGTDIVNIEMKSFIFSTDDTKTKSFGYDPSGSSPFYKNEPHLTGLILISPLFTSGRFLFLFWDQLFSNHHSIYEQPFKSSETYSYTPSVQKKS